MENSVYLLFFEKEHIFGGSFLLSHIQCRFNRIKVLLERRNSQWKYDRIVWDMFVFCWKFLITFRSKKYLQYLLFNSVHYLPKLQSNAGPNHPQVIKCWLWCSQLNRILIKIEKSHILMELFCNMVNISHDKKTVFSTNNLKLYLSLLKWTEQFQFLLISDGDSSSQSIMLVYVIDWSLILVKIPSHIDDVQYANSKIINSQYFCVQLIGLKDNEKLIQSFGASIIDK